MAKLGADGSAEIQAKARRWLLVAVSLIPAVVLLALAVPRTISAWTSFQAETNFLKIFRLPSSSDLELKDAVAGFVRAGEWTSSGRRLKHLAVVEMTQAQRLPASAPERVTLLESAERHLTAGLLADPVDGIGWHALVPMRQLRGSPARRIVEAELQSLDMAPSARWLWLPRAYVFFLYASALQGDELTAVASQLRMIWATDADLREPLISTAAAVGQSQMLAGALAADLEATAELERLKQRLSTIRTK